MSTSSEIPGPVSTEEYERTHTDLSKDTYYKCGYRTWQSLMYLEPDNSVLCQRCHYAAREPVIDHEIWTVSYPPVSWF
jgi:hypothetical protein